ncbi:chromophore lyase CpcT/CpeT [Nostocaceae cyanobacterium CENA369]|uniref:Chromophore lyase CpcT/CpeT n=1 Tax=Dendronalium phyllosphericum CENA369 TaxID=1725256 RepID=A0A8J7LFI6_9NOST|nr:chromophore lyase CpcT/CpeT [Dendronalium phyllosphericum]MBH8572019.1 chromophore lyase CpcT/CpeT [Dendronalium phyllosphericum CENA369]
MNLLKVYALTVILSGFTLAQANRATAITVPPLETQVKQVAQWFTGLFDNSQQVASNPSIPLITLSSCSVQLTDANPVIGIQNIYLEQKSINRFRLYSFSQGNSAVNLSIRAFDSSYPVSGLCNRPESEQVIDSSKVLGTSCNLELFWQSTDYIGNNAPNGCPTSSGGKVVSSVTVSKIEIDSLDKIFTANGNLLFATPIEFRRVYSIPEPSLTLGLLAIGIWGTSKVISVKMKNKKC